MAGHSDDDAPLIDLKDIEKLPLFLYLGATSWLLPPPRWSAVAQGLAALSGRLFSSRREHDATLIPAAIVDQLGASRGEVLQRFVAGFYEEYMQVLRSYRPGGWLRELRLTGGANIDAALAAGHGAIVWITPTAYSGMLVRAVLARAGYSESGLSRPQHGFSRTRFGMRFLNPIQRHAEDRYLAHRIVIKDDRTDIALRELRGCLTRNELVGITVGNQARRVERVPMLGGELEVATGPLNLSRTTGAPLLPAFLLAKGPASFELRIESPLSMSEGEGRQEQYREAALQYARLLEAYVRENPLMWRGWVEYGNWKPVSEAHN